MSKFPEIYQASIEEPDEFWLAAAKEITWSKPPTEGVRALTPPFYEWFADGELNACYNAVDRHVEAGRGEQCAIIYDSPVTQTISKISFNELLHMVSTTAGALRQMGVETGDRVVIYMPMIPEAVVAMLACARLGAIHSVVFGGFAAKELAVRIDDAAPKVVLSASCGIEVNRVIPYKPLLDQAIELAEHKPKHTMILQRPQSVASMVEGRDLDWSDTVTKADAADCVDVPSTHPLYILYTSGTTGQPKGVVRDTGGYCVALYWSMKNIYGVDPGDVFWSASDVGWVVGHSYITYGPLLHGNTTVVYEGKPVGTPDAGAFWRVIEAHDVKVLFTAPTAFRAIRKEDPQAELMRNYDIGCLEALYLAGERCDPDTLLWAQAELGVPVIDHWWQTETGWAIAANCRGIETLPIVPGSPTLPTPGYALKVLDAEGNDLAPCEIGALAIELPLPPGCFPTLWQAKQRYISSYFEKFPGYYETGDAGYIDENGYVFVMSRTDDVINVAGHRLSTGALEEVLSEHPAVAECAVVGVANALKGQMPLGLLVLSAGVQSPIEEIEQECIAAVRANIGAVAAFKRVIIVNRLPKTRSGKILRATIRAMADGQNWSTPATIDDPAILDEIDAKLQEIAQTTP